MKKGVSIMKKKRNLASFFAGVMTVLLTFGCLTSAMAASGEVTYNFANVTLNGEKKISAGSDIAVDNNSAKVTAYEYYEYELSYADGEKSSRGTTYAIELERENGEWRINNISTNSELEELVEDAPDVQMLFEDESTPVSNPDIERAHQQAEVLAEQADVERTERAAYTFHG